MSEIREILKDLRAKNFNKIGKNDRTFMLYDSLPTIAEFYIKKGHKAPKEVEELFDIMKNPKIVKTLNKILKTPDHSAVDYGFATVIANFLGRKGKEIDEELFDAYNNVIDKILKKRIKKVGKKTDVGKDLLKELLVIVAEPEAISNPRFVGLYVNRMTRKLYYLSKSGDLGLNDVDTLRKLLAEIFGKDTLNDVAVSILLERKEFIRDYNEGQKAMWNILTSTALDILEKNKKKDLKEVIEYYIERREKDAKNGKDSARRIQFSQISKDDYPKLSDVADKLGKKERNAKYL